MVISATPKNRPLFVPLRAAYFDAFAAGRKTEEWRRLGPRWNKSTCHPGRAVVLARGYGWPRLLAEIQHFRIQRPNTAERRALFGADTPCIVLHLRNIRPLNRPAPPHPVR